MSPVGAASASYYYAFAPVAQPAAAAPAAAVAQPVATAPAKVTPDSNADAIAAARTAALRAYSQVDSDLSNRVGDLAHDQDMVETAMATLAYAASHAVPTLDILL